MAVVSSLMCDVCCCCCETRESGGTPVSEECLEMKGKSNALRLKGGCESQSPYAPSS